VLKVVDIVLLLEERIKSRLQGKITAAACRIDLERSVKRLREKLRVTPAIRFALDDFEIAAIGFASEPEGTLRRNNVFGEAENALRRLRVTLEDATHALRDPKRDSKIRRTHPAESRLHLDACGWQ
jgi:hypothetical protein